MVPGEFSNGECPKTKIDDEFKPFVTDGFVSVGGGEPIPIKILRDTGASQTILLEGTLPLTNETSAKASVLIQGIGGDTISVPLHVVDLHSDLISGSVLVGVRPSTPIKGISMLLSNDLAGDKIIRNPHMIENPDHDVFSDDSDLYPFCAVTRAMHEKNLQTSFDNLSDQIQNKSLSDQTFLQNADLNNDTMSAKTFENDLDLSQTFMADLDSLDRSLLAPLKTDQSYKPVLSKETSVPLTALNRDILITKQKSDPDLALLFEKAVSENEAVKSPVCYYLKSGLLMRKWRPADAACDEEWLVLHQIVVPSSYRQNILSLAHDSPIVGHLSVDKTCDRIL